MSLTTGDYDNDGIDEIAVEYRTTFDPWFKLCTFDYENGKLVQKDHYSDSASFGHYNLVDLTSGDFDGDGADEIASIIARCTTNNHSDTLNPYILINIYKMDENLNIEMKSFYCSGNDDIYCNKGAAITSGLFKYSPSNDANNNYSVARRQLAIIHQSEYKEGIWQPHLSTYDVDNNFKVTRVSHIAGRGKAGHYADKREVACLKPEITAGRFLTLGNSWINDQIVASWGHTPLSGWDSVMIFNVYFVDYEMNLSILGNQAGYYFSPHDYQYSIYNHTSVPIVAACNQEGKSYYLGTPIHITIPQFIRANRVVQEPPKHLDYLPDEKGGWEIVNPSRTRAFYAAFKDTEETSITTTSTDQTNWNIGGSENVTAKETIKGGIPDIEEAKITATESEKVSYDYNSVTKKLDGNYSEVTIYSEFDTKRDDYLQVFVQMIDIWRYPIYGLKTQDGKNAFYEVVMPGPQTKLNTTGCNFSDYYQPIHENGNVLSYPRIDTEGFPYDLGSFYVGTEKKTCRMTNDSTFTVGTLSGYEGVSWANSAWNSETKSHTHKLSENADLKVGVKMKTIFETWSVKADFSFHNSNSWSKTSFSENKTSSNKGITIYFPDDGETKYSYNFRPIVYATTDGTLKLAHTVNPGVEEGYSWWHNNYYGRPDIALNLPNKFYWEKSQSSEYYGTWYLKQYRQDRSQMRGVFLLKQEPDLNNSENNWYLASSPTAGEKIWVLTRVYNYSLGTETGEFKVRFSYADLNTDLKDNPPNLHTIGETTVNNLDPGETKEVYVVWDTTGLGGEAAGSGKNYVIYITVDPDNDVPNEIHELYVKDQSPAPGPCPVGPNEYSAECGIFCGSNNQGYWPWDNSFMIFAPKTGGENYNEPAVDISIAQKSLEIEFTSESQGYGPYIFTHLPYRLKLKVVAGQAVKDHREVLFYDNDKVFSMKRSFGLNPGENDFYCRWTPSEPGERTLKVAILEDEDDPVPGDAIVTLDVNVLDFNPPHR